jgi:ATP-dependent DNA helicase RecG
MEKNIQETQSVELKETWRDEYIKTIAAFANTDGGRLLVGYDDDGVLVGVSNSRRLLEDLPNKIANALGMTVGVMLREHDGLEFVEVEVAKCNFLVSYQSRFYIRSGSTTQEVRGAELQQLVLKANNMFWDEVTLPDVSFDVIDREAVKLFVYRAVLHNRMPPDVEADDIRKLFHNLRLTNEAGELTRAAILLFAKHPTRWFTPAVFKVGRFGGSDPTNLMFHDMVEGNIFQMPDRVMDFLKSKYLISLISYQGLQRIETLEIPEKAMREAVLNAVIHRDYSSSSSVELRVFDKTLTLWNHGIVVPPLTIEQLTKKHASYPRNPLIAKIFYRSGAIETWGRGTLSIISQVTERGLAAPSFEEFSGGVEVTFLRPDISAKEVAPASNAKLNGRQQKAVEYVREHGSISNAEYRAINETSKNTASRELVQLVELLVLQKKGEGKYITYILIGS